MHDQKLVGRHANVIVRSIGKPAQMPQPFMADQVAKIPWRMPFRPDVPGRNNENKERQILPSQKRAKSHPPFSIKYKEKTKNRRRINGAKQTFCQAGERRAEPKASEPGGPIMPALITAEATENCACNERADKRLRHHDACEQKCAAETEINQTGNKSAPVIGKFFSNQENQRD